MTVHRLTHATVRVPDVDLAGAFYSEFGLTEAAPGRFATTDGGEQLRLVAGASRGLVELGLGVDDPDDLSEMASKLAQFGLEPQTTGSSLSVVEPVTGVRVTATVAPRLASLSRGGPDPVLQQPAGSAADRRAR